MPKIYQTQKYIPSPSEIWQHRCSELKLIDWLLGYDEKLSKHEIFQLEITRITLIAPKCMPPRILVDFEDTSRGAG